MGTNTSVRSQTDEKQVLIRLGNDVHTAVSILAATKNNSIRQYVEEAVLERVQKDLSKGVGAKTLQVFETVGKLGRGGKLGRAD